MSVNKGRPKGVISGFTCFVCARTSRVYVNSLNKFATDFTCGDDYCVDFLADNALDERLTKLTTAASKLFARPDIDKKLDTYKADVANCCAAAQQRTTALREKAAAADRDELLDELLTTARETADIKRENAAAVAEKEEKVEIALANAAAQPARTAKTARTRVGSKRVSLLLFETIYDILLNVFIFPAARRPPSAGIAVTVRIAVIAPLPLHAVAAPHLSLIPLSSAT